MPLDWCPFGYDNNTSSTPRDEVINIIAQTPHTYVWSLCGSLGDQKQRWPLKLLTASALQQLCGQISFIHGVKVNSAELSMGWVDPWVGLGRDFSVFVGLGQLQQKFENLKRLRAGFLSC